MTYLSKTYTDFLSHHLTRDMINQYLPDGQILNEKNNTVWVAEKVNCLRQKINQLRKELSGEYDPNVRKKKQLQIKVCELKIMIANIK